MSGLTIREVQMRVRRFGGAPVLVPRDAARVVASTVGSGSLAVRLQLPALIEDLDDLAAAREAEEDIARHGAVRWEDLDNLDAQ